MESLLLDLRFALRQMRRSPGFAFAAVMTLALGIGANATIFQWADWLVSNPLPRVDTRGLHYIRWRMPEGRSSSTSWPTFMDIRQRAKTLEHFAVGRQTAFSLGEGERPERVFGMLVSSNYFDALGVRPMLGRAFVAEEDRDAGAHPVAVISHSLWSGRFRADRTIIGRTIRLNTRPFTVIGITHPGFIGSTVGLRHDLWVPATMREAIMGNGEALKQRDDRWLEAYARLRPGVTFPQAEQELNAISAGLARELQNSSRFARVDGTPLWRSGAGQVLAPVLTLLAAVTGLVLLIACANVGNLLLARGAHRQKEMALRLALGVRRGRLMRQLMVENGLLAAAAGLVALLVVPLGAGLLMRFAPDTDLPIDLTVESGWRVFAFVLGASALATLLTGLMPALRASGGNLIDTIKAAGGAVTARSRLRSSLVVGQVALSVLLLVGAGLLLRSLRNATTLDPGFDPRNVLVAGVDLLPNGYDAARGAIFVQQAVERIGRLPGVTAVSTVRRVPLSIGGSSSMGFSVDGYTPAREEAVIAYVNYAGPDYFRTMNTPVLAGRDFRPDDAPGRPPVVVINETLARRYFAGREAVGSRLRAVGREFTIAGVVKDSKYQSLDEPAAPMFWFAVQQIFASETNFLVRTQGDPMQLARAVEDEIHAMNAAIPLYGVRSLQSSIGAAYFPQRIGGWLMGFFGALALVLAAVGLHGVLAYTLALRSREVGIRAALGAAPSALAGMIFGEGLKLAGIGAGVGVALAFAAAPLLAKLLLGVPPRDPVTLALVPCLLLLAAAAASALPARRAALADPLVAMRSE